MPIQIGRVSKSEYTAAVSPSAFRDVTWSTNEPMRQQALIDSLVELGYHLQDIADAFDQADANWPDRKGDGPEA